MWFTAGAVGGGAGAIAAMEVIGLPIVLILLGLLVVTAFTGATSAALVGFGLAYAGVVVWAGVGTVTCSDCSPVGNPFLFYVPHLALGLATCAFGAAMLVRRRPVP
ncbi:MAG: hypothetical protein NVS1B3_16670 [Candidatus Dormibacteraceae bacterium]